MFSLNSKHITEEVKKYIGDKKLFEITIYNSEFGTSELRKKQELKLFRILKSNSLSYPISHYEPGQYNSNFIKTDLYFASSCSGIRYGNYHTGTGWGCELIIDEVKKPVSVDVSKLERENCQKIFANELLLWFGYQNNELVKHLNKLTVECLDEIYGKQRSLKESYSIDVDAQLKELRKRITNEAISICECCNKIARKAVHYNEFEEQCYLLESLFKSIDKHTKLFHAHRYHNYNDSDEFIGLFPKPSYEAQWDYDSLDLRKFNWYPKLDELLKDIDFKSAKPVLSEFEDGIINGFKEVSIFDFVKKYCSIDMEKKLSQLEIESVQRDSLPMMYSLCGFIERREIEDFMKDFTLDIQTLLVKSRLEEIAYIDPFAVRENYSTVRKANLELTHANEELVKELDELKKKLSSSEESLRHTSEELTTNNQRMLAIVEERESLKAKAEELESELMNLKSALKTLM